MIEDIKRGLTKLEKFDQANDAHRYIDDDHERIKGYVRWFLKTRSERTRHSRAGSCIRFSDTR